jgi:RNA-directed DNA polymerase
MFRLVSPILTLLVRRPGAPLQADVLRLGAILGIAPTELSTVRLGRCYHYHPLSIPKRDGRERALLAPSPALKSLQRRLLRRHLARLPIHPAATAFRPGGSIVANARHHAGQALVATVDIADFFPSTSANRVRSFFLAHGWRGEALSTLMRLCVYRGGLPQGAPTSPCLSNLVNVELDEALDALARRSGGTYTRYGDDLTFSWPTGRIPSHVERTVRKHLLQAGYRVQPRKGWRVQRLAAEPEVNGVVLARDGGLRAPARVRRQARRLRRRWRWHPDEVTRARLLGYEGYIRMIEGER